MAKVGRQQLLLYLAARHRQGNEFLTLSDICKRHEEKEEIFLLIDVIILQDDTNVM